MSFGVGSSPALATCETSQVLLAGVSGAYRMAMLRRPSVVRQQVQRSPLKENCEMIGKMLLSGWKLALSMQIDIKFTFMKTFSSQGVVCSFSETAGPIKAKLHVGHRWEGATKVCINDQDGRHGCK